MNRRKFILRNGLLVPLVLALPSVAFPQILLQGRKAVRFPPAGGGGGSCPADGSPSSATTGSSLFAFLPFPLFEYVGQSNWDDSASPVTICKLGFQLTLASGSISGKTFKAYIYANSGANIVPASPLATSNGVTGSNAWSATMVRFTFPTPFLTTASTKYALVCNGGAPDASNYASLDNSAGSTIPGFRDFFDGSGNANFASGTTDCVMEIYWL
jgi:hypothetical protein